MSAEAPARRPEQNSIGFNLAAIAAVLALAGLGLAYLIAGASEEARHPAPRLDDGITLVRSVGGVELAIPQSWFRYEEQQGEAFAKLVELRLELPLGAEGAMVPVDVTLLPRSRARPSAALLDGVYLHQFEPEQLAGPPGLVGKPLRAGGGYDNETVWYDALAADPFVAKCSPPVTETAEGQCLRTVYLRPGMAAVYGFPVSALAGWRGFDAALAPRLKQIGAL